MCKEGIHLCNDVLIPTLAVIPGERMNSEAWTVNTEISPTLPSLIFMGSSSLFFTTMS